MMGQPEAEQPKLLVKGMQSFKVLAECPIIVVSLFQAHRNCVHKNVKLFVPLIKEVCAVNCPFHTPEAFI